MCFLRRLLDKLRPQQDPAPRSYQMNVQLQTIIEEIAQQEQRPLDEIHDSLLATGLAQRTTSDELWARWETLSVREKEVAALICLAYTNVEIASRLGVSPTTIKTHIRNVLSKFQLHGKGELRIALQEWNFRDWDRSPP